MTTRPECEQFVGRRRKICEGTSGLPLPRVNAYRAQWGLEPFDKAEWSRLDGGDNELSRHATQVRSFGLGDRVSQFITSTTGIKPCGGCKKRAAVLNHWFPADYPPIEHVDLSSPTRHCVFHVWPTSNGGWQWNCDRLLERADLFNGRRIVGIVHGHGSDSPDAVKHYLRDFADEFVVMRNKKRLREVVTWIPMLERLEKCNSPQDVTFACHSKCARHNTRPEHAGSTIYPWTLAMWETCGHWPSVRPLLESHGAVGSFRRYGPNSFHSRRGGFADWHFSGTFYWFRNHDAFRRNWRYVPQTFFGTEAWPGWLFKLEESACIVCDQCGDLYKMDYWKREIEPQLKRWRAEHERR